MNHEMPQQKGIMKFYDWKDLFKFQINFGVQGLSYSTLICAFEMNSSRTEPFQGRFFTVHMKDRVDRYCGLDAEI